ncbi:sulfatase [Roseiconus nitratireducens]|uniref:Sulfatase n=2 Tax=Roseiconus nitratireducens TaxID=2605748 RepID=A0A5M6D226_9BACT|nr:sulfatase [Roseiconus nitratireducens]
MLVLAFLLGTQARASTAESLRPNVVFFLVDDMGWMDSTPYGSTYYETPNMQRLAEQSMRFTDAFAVPLCSPTRASILTGQYSARHGITSATGHLPPRPHGESRFPAKAPPNKRFLYPDSKHFLDPELVTIAEVLRDAGYRTGHFGKWHLGLMPEHWPEQQGFETTWHCAPDPGPPSYFSPYGVHADGGPAGQRRVGNITDGPDGEHITDRVTDEALKFIDSHADQPFFLNLWHYSVHGPWQHKEAYTAQFAEKSDPSGRQKNPVMASMLRNVDESLGRVLDRLDALGLTDRTLFIFYSDNGGNTHSWTADDRKLRNVTPKHSLYETINSYRKWAGDQPPTNNAPLREGKGRIYEGGQRVPLMVRWPGQVPAGSTSDAVVGPIDMFPTILDAVEVPLPSGQVIDGVSFLSVLQQRGDLDRKAVFTWFPHLIPAVSVRAGDFKLIRRWESHPAYPEVLELYDLDQDLGESSNLADAMPNKVRELNGMIDDFIRTTGALEPVPNPAFDAQASSRAPAARDPAAGLVPKMCRLLSTANGMQMVADGRSPFLGTAQIRHEGSMRLRMEVRCREGGDGSIRWKTARQSEFPSKGQEVAFTLRPGSDWQTVEVALPVEGRSGIVRIYLPADRAPVQIRSIEFFASAESRVNAEKPEASLRRWEFQKPTP